MFVYCAHCFVTNNLYDVECCYEDNPTTPDGDLIDLFAELLSLSNRIFLPVIVR